MALSSKILLFSTLLASCLLLACTKDSNDSGHSSAELSSDACQVLSLSNKTHTRIVNGTACGQLERSPVVRVVLINDAGKSAFCSGTMITNSTVLTAAHCFLSNPVEVVVLAGRSVDTAIDYQARSWIVHPNFAPQGSRAINDVAIVRLVRNTDLPTVPVMTEEGVNSGEVVSIFGYGKDEDGNLNFDDLKSGEMRVSGVDHTHIITKFDGSGSNTCQGDSGGPLLSTRSGRAAIAGITSSGLNVDCQAGDTSYFTNMTDSNVSEFLKTNVPSAQFL